MKAILSLFAVLLLSLAVSATQYESGCFPRTSDGQTVSITTVYDLTSTTWGMDLMVYLGENCVANQFLGTIALRASLVQGAAGSATVLNPNPQNLTTIEGPRNLDVTFSTKTFNASSTTGVLVFNATCGVMGQVGVPVSFHEQGCMKFGIVPAAYCPTFYDVVQIAPDRAYFGNNAATGLSNCLAVNRTNTLNPIPFTEVEESSASTLAFSTLLVVFAALFALMF